MIENLITSNAGGIVIKLPRALGLENSPRNLAPLIYLSQASSSSTGTLSSCQGTSVLTKQLRCATEITLRAARLFLSPFYDFARPWGKKYVARSRHNFAQSRQLLSRGH